MICSNCGKEIEGGKFCPFCGTAVEAPEAEKKLHLKSSLKSLPLKQLQRRLLLLKHPLLKHPLRKQPQKRLPQKRLLLKNLQLRMHP